MIATSFTPLHSLGGGALIGLAAVLLMMLFGRVMGATGILGGVLQPVNLPDWSWRAAVLLGMIAAPLKLQLLTGSMPVVQVPVSTGMLIVGGVLVGLGTTFGAGCTSGHGVCGIARLSQRSIIATVVFMLFTTMTVYVLRHGMGVSL